MFSDEEEEEEEEDNDTYYYVDHMENEDHHLVANTIPDTESLQFLPNRNGIHKSQNHVEEFMNFHEPVLEDQDDDNIASDGQLSLLASAGSESEHDDADMVEEKMPTSDDADSVHYSAPNQGGPTPPISIQLHKSDSDQNCGGICIILGFYKFVTLVTCCTLFFFPTCSDIAYVALDRCLH